MYLAYGFKVPFLVDETFINEIINYFLTSKNRKVKKLNNNFILKRVEDKRYTLVGIKLACQEEIFELNNLQLQNLLDMKINKDNINTFLQKLIPKILSLWLDIIKNQTQLKQKEGLDLKTIEKELSYLDMPTRLNFELFLIFSAI